MKQELLGSVRSVRTEWGQWDLTNEVWGEADRTMVEEYRPDGKCLSTEVRYASGSAHRTTHTYDDSGVLTESSYYNGDQAAGRCMYFYDDQGRPTLHVGVAAEGSESVCEEYSYGADGTQRKVVHAPPMAGQITWQCVVDGEGYYVSAEGMRAMIVTYGADGRESEVTVTGADGELLRRLVRTRDGSGLRRKAELLLGSTPLIPEVPAIGPGFALLTEEYIYDERRRRIETRQGMFGLSEARETHTYDERGNRTAASAEETSTSARFAEDGSVVPEGPVRVERRRTRFAYRYDAHGNWVERITSQRYGENPDFTPSVIERQLIQYYD